MVQFIVILADLISNAITLFSFLLIAYILMSWVPSMREGKFGQLLGKIVDPYLSFFRQFIPPLGMIDISPIVAIFALRFIDRGVATIFNMIIQAIY
ncbi:YggT family protein [Sporosarcina sp. Marseille-Q4063]|uniref:YggT family protein n=1 Tax=Sporosarcina sp. Marseille-Q4063 TaxID=2810514 RepID=UPI001BAFE246|nr:YggT family protein [Sporosarcina sp. Marseille-Q4063]QUW21809.1 YggT family protein [Sporosarcina sp. Marseille-Q4063]